MSDEKPKRDLVILAEDSDDMADRYTQAITKAGYEVVRFNDGRKALDHIRQLPEESKRRAVLVTDNSMITMFGIQPNSKDGLIESLSKEGIELPTLLLHIPDGTQLDTYLESLKESGSLSHVTKKEVKVDQNILRDAIKTTIANFDAKMAEQQTPDSKSVSNTVTISPQPTNDIPPLT